MKLKDRLKDLRGEKKITATQLAFQLGKSESTVRMWEAGRSNPDADTLICLSRFFNCSTDYLLGLSEYKTEQEKANLFHDLSKSDNQRLMQDPETLKIIQGLLDNQDLFVFIRELSKYTKDEQQEVLEFMTIYSSLKSSKTNRRVLLGACKAVLKASFSAVQS